MLVEHFTRGGNGTMIARDPLVRVRNASIEDIGDIIGLIQPLEEQGVLVKRSREHLEVEIGEYSVLEHDGKIYGCVAMHPFTDAGTAELACLAVAQDKRDGGFGEMLLKHVEYQARTQGLQSLFVLTTQTAHWFVERGFAEADRARCAGAAAVLQLSAPLQGFRQGLVRLGPRRGWKRFISVTQC